MPVHLAIQGDFFINWERLRDAAQVLRLLGQYLTYTDLIQGKAIILIITAII